MFYLKIELLKTHRNEFIVSHDQNSVKKIRASCVTIRSIRNKLYTINVFKKGLSKMDWKRFWLSSSRCVGYEHPMINKLRKAGDRHTEPIGS